MTIQCLILWEVTTPYHGVLQVNARDEEEALVKTILFIEETPLNEIVKTTIDQLKVATLAEVIESVII
jgi:hypothetical protein